MRLAIGCDHAALELKNIISKHLQDQGIEVIDITTEDGDRQDYPYCAERAALEVREGRCQGGVLICGTGIGMAIAANKVNGIRAAACSEAYSARMSKEHNDANVICLGARVVGPEVAKDIVDAWLNARFLGGRHARRVAVFEEIENRNK